MREKNDSIQTNNRVWTCIKIIIFWCIVIVLILCASRIVERKDSQKKYEDFFKLSDQIDVLFLGSSHVLNSLNPLQMYQEYGITSYNMGKPGGMITEAYWTLQNALDYCEPKCIVLDLWAIDRDYKYLDIMNGTETEETIKNSVSLLHTNMDCWPISKTKYQAIKDLIQDKEIRKEFLWDFSLYHDRWSALEKSDFVHTSGLYIMGAEERTEIFSNPKIEQPEDRIKNLPAYSICQQYLDKILDICESKDIQVMLTFMPMTESYEQDWQAVNYGETLARERDMLFYNMLSPETQSIIDYTTDMSDSSHLNANGMKKMTSFIGKELNDVYRLPDHREDSAYDYWNQKAAEWATKNKSELQSCTDVYRALSLVNSTTSNAIIYLPYDSVYLHNETVRNLLKQITGSNLIEEAKDANGPYLCVVDTNSSNRIEIIEWAGEEQTEDSFSLLGKVEYIGLRNFAALYQNGNYENNFLNMDEHMLDDMQLILLDENGENIKCLYFSVP